MPLRVAKCLTSPNDPLSRVFMALFRDAMYVTDAGDLAKVKAALAALGHDAKFIAALPRSYFTRRVRRTISPNTQFTLARVVALFNFFKPRRTLEGAPFFNHLMESTLEGLTTHLVKGCLRDPHDITLSTEIGVEGGLPLLRKKGGTVDNEAFHAQVPCAVSSFNTLPELVNALLSNMLSRYNLKKQCTSQGMPLPICYDFERMDEIVRLVAAAFGPDAADPFKVAHIVTPVLTEEEVANHGVRFGCVQLLPRIDPVAAGAPGPSTGGVVVGAGAGAGAPAGAGAGHGVGRCEKGRHR